jgi:hypothetical protein
MTGNSFPESNEKNILRNLDKLSISEFSTEINSPLNYLGLPASEMLDVLLWKQYLNTITAIERSEDAAEGIIQTSSKNDIRENLILLEMDLALAFRLLGTKDDELPGLIATLSSHDKDQISKARKIPYHVANLDLYSGFLYPDKNNQSSLIGAIDYLFDHQNHHKCSFLLIVTLEFRDTGASQYKEYIKGAISHLEKALRQDLDELQRYYLNKSKVDDAHNIPDYARYYRFCVPIHLHQNAWRNNFRMDLLGQWVYKNYYHAVLKFVHEEGTTFGLGPWPPVDEVKSLLQANLIKIFPDGNQKDYPPPQIDKSVE